MEHKEILEQLEASQKKASKGLKINFSTIGAILTFFTFLIIGFGMAYLAMSLILFSWNIWAWHWFARVFFLGGGLALSWRITKTYIESR